MGECKFLLKTHAGISFLENQLRTALTFDFDKIVVVCSPERSEDVKRIISSLHSERILFVLNDQAGSERFYSIQCGLKLLKDHDQCFIQNTDCPELIIKTMMPNLVHIFPVIHNTMLNGILQSKNTTLGQWLLPNKTFFILHTTDNILEFRSTHNGRERWSWSILAAHTCLTHSWAIVDDYGACIVTHFRVAN